MEIDFLLEEEIINRVADCLRDLRKEQIKNTLILLNEGCTIPFIARYRKEKTGNLDEVQIQRIRDEARRIDNLEKRRKAILQSIREQGKLTDELERKIVKAETLSALEDLYLPYKPKKKTRATIAKEKGLEPLAKVILENHPSDLRAAAEPFLNVMKDVFTVDDALEGAQDIIAEWISEMPEIRDALRNYYHQHAMITSRVVRGKEEEGKKYEQYFRHSEMLKNCPGHRMLAIRRGEKEGFLIMEIEVDNAEGINIIKRFVKIPANASGEIMLNAIQDAFKRLLHPAMEAEMRAFYKEKADREAIEVFAANLRELLMASPLGMKRILAIDPGFRTGCKVVALDETGKLLEDQVIYPHEPHFKKEESEFILLAMMARHRIEAIAVGNGTAGRETLDFVRSIPELPKEIIVCMVNESGASVYSASEIAREEFPDKDVTVRGAVSIGRRLADPLAELVKIDPKSIGVGQYQHDVDQQLLKDRLDEVVEYCVNQVGVELNTASVQLLSYVSGIGKSLAESIVAYRNQHGAFRSREELKKVPGMGEKRFEQCAGFLRIRDAENPLDATAVHPERYGLVEQMACSVGCSVKELITKPEFRKKIKKENFLNEETGRYTIDDILAELEKPGRDPRKEFEVVRFDDNIRTLEDLRVGMELEGVVSNVTNFGVFVDVGVHQDGLVHISELSDSYVDDPAKVVKPGQRVRVKVLEVDYGRRRISLSMRSQPNEKRKNFSKEQNVENMDMGQALELLKSKFGKK
jgi:uncharacterized protein